MDEKKSQVEPIPYIVFESEMARAEREKFRLWVLLIISILLLFGSNAAWIAYESSYQDETITQEVAQTTDTGGNNHNIFYGGDYNDGDASNTNDDQEARPQDGWEYGVQEVS